jgi:hypothetical protein
MTNEDDLQKRITKVKEKFKLKEFLPSYEHCFGKQSLEEKLKIVQVWNGEITDLKITERFEYIVDIKM